MRQPYHLTVAPNFIFQRSLQAKYFALGTGGAIGYASNYSSANKTGGVTFAGSLGLGFDVGIFKGNYTSASVSITPTLSTFLAGNSANNFTLAFQTERITLPGFGLT